MSASTRLLYGYIYQNHTLCFRLWFINHLLFTLNVLLQCVIIDSCRSETSRNEFY